MADNKKSFVAYCDWGDIFDELSDSQAGALAKHLFDYVRDKNPTPKDNLTKLLFIQIQQALKRDLVKYEKYIEKQKSNGSKGGRPKNPTVSQKTQRLNEEPKKADNVTVNVNVTVNDINKRKELFTAEIRNFLNKYGKDMCTSFYNYWTEHNTNGKKMRFEMAKNQPFNISLRLSTWKKRSNNTTSKKIDNKTVPSKSDYAEAAKKQK